MLPRWIRRTVAVAWVLFTAVGLAPPWEKLAAMTVIEAIRALAPASLLIFAAVWPVVVCQALRRDMRDYATNMRGEYVEHVRLFKAEILGRLDRAGIAP